MSEERNDRIWREILSKGPCCLTKQNWQMIEHELDEQSREVFRLLVESIEGQARWNELRAKELHDEYAHIEAVGRMMRRAGLRSYTDQRGRIFVAQGEP